MLYYNALSAISEMFKPEVLSFLFKLWEKKVSVRFLSNFSIIEKAIGTKFEGRSLGQF